MNQTTYKSAVTADAAAALRASEARLAAEAAALTRLNQASSHLWRIQNLRDGLDEMLAVTIELLGADKGNIQLLEAEREVLVIAAQRGFSQPFLDYFHEVSTQENSACGRALRSGRRIIIEDVETDEPYTLLRPVAREAGYRAVQSTPLIGRDGVPLGMISTHFRVPHRPIEHELRLLDLYARQAADFIERCRLDEALRESVAVFRAIGETVPDFLWLSDAQGRPLYENPAWCVYTGLTHEEFLQASWEALYHPDDLPALQQLWAEASQHGGTVQFEARVRRHDGDWRWFAGQLAPIKDEAGVTIKWVGAQTDIQERKRIEAALKERSDELRQFLDTSATGLTRLSRDLRYLAANEAYARIAGVPLDQIVGHSMAEVMGSTAIETIRPYFERALRGEIVEYEAVVPFSVAGDQFLHVVYTPWRESDGSVSGWVASVTDITARKQAEAALQSAYNELAQSNAALQAKEIERRALLRQLVTVQENERQRLSRELHDQTGQHLAALRMMLSILNEPLQTQPEQFQVFTQIRQLTDKLGQDLHTLAWELRPTRLQEAGLAVALAQYVQECSARTSIAMDFHFKGDEQRRFPVLHEIITYRVVQEALTNVLKYAQAQQVSVVLEYFPDRLRAIVEDDGVGFAPEKLGTSDDGLGLRGMRERAALADGKLEIESSIGYGTTIYLTLPLTENDRPEGVV